MDWLSGNLSLYLADLASFLFPSYNCFYFISLMSFSTVLVQLEAWSLFVRHPYDLFYQHAEVKN